MGVENTTDTWILVESNSKVQHTLPTTIMKLGIQWRDFSFSLQTSEWITSQRGLKYLNKTINMGTSFYVLFNAMIYHWDTTEHLITVSVYDNSYLQFRSETATNSNVYVRVFFC